MKRSPLKRGKPYDRTPEQVQYHLTHPHCEILRCKDFAMKTPHHIDSRKLREDSPENMMSLCWNHHIGNQGVHSSIGKKRWIERYGLQEDPKWKEVYGRVKDR